MAAALLRSEERLEYSLGGGAMNVASASEQWAEAGQTVLSQATADTLEGRSPLGPLPPAHAWAGT